MPFPPKPTNTLKIYDTIPPESEDTFNAGIQITDDTNEACAIILYSPNLQIIASLDNTNSEVTSTYETSVTHGFTFSTTQSMSITEEVGINIEVVTEKTSITFALSFTEQWSTTTTKSMSFSCPPGKMAFVYQGTLVARVMSLNSETAQYSWKAAPGKALTQVLTTSETPIGAAPSNSVTVGS
jgi:hypothetical protein